MTDKWQAGKTYAPGSLVTPASAPVVDATQAENGDFAAGDTGWDYTGSCAFSSTGGYSNANCCVAPGVTAGGLALNKAKFLMSPGETISANCMIQQGASDVDHTRGYVQVLFFDATDTQIGDPVSGNIVNDGRGGAWHQSTLATPAAAPAGTAYARCGIYLYQNSADPIWGDNLVVYYARRKPAAGLIFKATQASPGKSAQTEPVWPTTTGVEVTDNEVTWEGVIATRLVWEASPILKSGATEPTWPDSIGGAVHDGTIDWIAVSRRVEDVNCPNSKVVAIMASKIFAADGDIVRFSATVNPLDWSSSQNAGYLPTGLQQANANDMAVLAPYRSNLTAFNASSFQNWQVDPDPAAMALLDQMDGIGSRHQHAAQAVGNDLYYLSQLGVRTVSIAAGTDNLKAGDVGMPVDVLVRESIRVAAANDTPVVATYYPSAGQYWLAVRALQPLAIAGHLPSELPGVAVSYQYDVSGGVLPRVVSIDTGALPAGLDMDPTGLVTGQFADLVATTWTVKAIDADGSVATLTDSYAPIATYANWDSMTVPSNGALSTDLATLSATNSTTGSVFSSVPITGKCYFEAHVSTTISVDGAEAGVASAEFDRRVLRMGEGSGNSLGVRCPDGTVKASGTVLGTLGGAVLGSSMRLRFAVDGRKIWVGCVGQSTWVGGGDPASGTTPTYTMPGTNRLFPGGSINQAGSATVRYICNPSDFTGAVPAGFSASLWAPLDDGYAATLDPIVTNPDCVLSNGNLTGTNTGSILRYAWTVSTRIKRRGKPYWEVVAKSGVNTQDRCVWGILNEGSDYPRYFFMDAFLRGYGLGASGAKYVGVTASALTTGINTGDVIRNRFDIDIGTYEIAVNGGPWLTIATGITGPGWRVAMASYYGVYNAEGGTFNFGASAFAYPVPTGYDAGWLKD